MLHKLHWRCLQCKILLGQYIEKHLIQFFLQEYWKGRCLCNRTGLICALGGVAVPCWKAKRQWHSFLHFTKENVILPKTNKCPSWKRKSMFPTERKWKNTTLPFRPHAHIIFVSSPTNSTAAWTTTRLFWHPNNSGPGSDNLLLS